MYTDVPMRDLIIPLALVSRDGEDIRYERLAGTAFSISQAEFLLTAKHVLVDPANMIGLQVIDERWRSVGIDVVAIHDDLDIALLRPHWATKPRDSLRISLSPEYGSCEYHVWGYPEDVLYDQGPGIDGLARQLPDLIFSAGHIRRRVSFQLPAMIGQEFFELSEVAGHGCSGAPVISKSRRPYGAVCGIYVGERTIETNGLPLRSLGYASRIEDIGEWLRNAGVAEI